MWKKIAIAGGTAAVIIGAGTAALAESSSSPVPTPSASSSSGSTAAGKSAAGGLFGGKLGRRVVDGQVVTRGKDGTFVTHDIIRGQVTAVSASSITVKAADNTSRTFVVTSTTKVRVRSNGKGAAGTISQVTVGEQALVVGTGASTATATGIVAGATK